MFGFENYADFKLAGEHAQMPELDAETAADIDNQITGRFQAQYGLGISSGIRPSPAICRKRVT